MSPELHDDIRKERIRKNSSCRLKNCEDSKSRTESCVSLKINRYSLNGKSSQQEMSTYPVDKEFFTDESYQCKKMKKDSLVSNENKEGDLVHIIQTFHGPSKKKKIKVEEVYEKSVIKNIPQKIRYQTKSYRTNGEHFEDEVSKSCEFSVGDAGEIKRDHDVLTSKIVSNKNIYLEKRRKSGKFERSSYKKSTQNICSFPTESFIGKATLFQKLRNYPPKIRPYMLNAKSRREVRDFDQYLRKRKASMKKKPAFEVKYISSGFVRSSDLSLPESNVDSDEILTHSRVMEKYRTEPIINTCKTEVTEVLIPTTEALGKTDILDARQREMYEFFEEYPKLMSSNRKTSKSSSIFEKLKGDERDLPGIYSRFVRRSKGVSNRYSDIAPRNFCSSNNICDSEKNYFNTDVDLEDHMVGELIREEQVDDKLLELMNEAPFKLGKEYDKKIKIENLATKEGVIQETPSKSLEKKEKMSIHKKLKVKSIAHPKSIIQKRSSNLVTTQNIKKVSKKKLSKKTPKNEQNEILNKSENDMENYGPLKQTSVILENDPIRENLNMSPTTAITMMVLAADKILAGKAEFFGKKIDE